MERLKRLLVAAFVTIALIVTPVHAGADEEESNDNAAVAISTNDGMVKFKVKYRAVRVEPGEDDPDNAAFAYSSCNTCKATAIAVHVALAEKPVDSDFSPTNLAIAINDQCTGCESVALAHQIVREVEENVRLTGDGKVRIARIVKRIRGLRDDGLTPPELDAQVDTYVDQIKVVLDEELVPHGDHEEDDDEDSDWDG